MVTTIEPVVKMAVLAEEPGGKVGAEATMEIKRVPVAVEKLRDAANKLGPVVRDIMDSDLATPGEFKLNTVEIGLGVTAAGGLNEIIIFETGH